MSTRHPTQPILRLTVRFRFGAWAAGPISGWERPQWCGKPTSPGPRGDDADAPQVADRKIWKTQALCATVRLK